VSAANLVQSAWSWLERELQRWSDCGLEAQFWWRDDDAIGNSPALERLLALSRKRQVPLALAVIPARLDEDLAQGLREFDLVSVLQHGYAHTSHAFAGQRKIELGGARSLEALARDLVDGRQILQQAFDTRFVPVLVPPWNRIDAGLLDLLPRLGFNGLSTLKARRAAEPAIGLRQINTHLDPINWAWHSGFRGVYPSIAQLVQHLVARRSGYRDRTEPTGILSHHLVQNDATWSFLDDLLQFLGEQSAVRFVGAAELWPGRDADSA